MPHKGDETLQQYLDHYTKKTGLWSNYPKYLVSTLKAYYGKHATAENDFGYGFLPKLTGNHSFFEYLYDMLDGKMEGMFLMGQNPAVGAPNSRLQRKALSKLKWLVVRELVEIESANFWRESPEVERGELKPEDIETEVFLFPAAGHEIVDDSQRCFALFDSGLCLLGNERSESFPLRHDASRFCHNEASRYCGCNSRGHLPALRSRPKIFGSPNGRVTGGTALGSISLR